MGRGAHKPRHLGKIHAASPMRRAGRFRVMRRFGFSVWAAIVLMIGAMPVAADCELSGGDAITGVIGDFSPWDSIAGHFATCEQLTFETSNSLDETLQGLVAAPPEFDFVRVTTQSLLSLQKQRLLRPLDDLLAESDIDLRPEQLISVDGRVMAIALFVNTQVVLYRADVFADLELRAPVTYVDILKAASRIRDAGVMDAPLAAMYGSTRDLGLAFMNRYAGEAGAYFDENGRLTLADAMGVNVLNDMADFAEFLPDEFLEQTTDQAVARLTSGEAAIAVLWASRVAEVMSARPTVSGEGDDSFRIATAPAPRGTQRPAATLWWDGLAIAAGSSDAKARASFEVIQQLLDRDFVKTHNDLALWIGAGYRPGSNAAAAVATASNGADSFSLQPEFGLLMDLLGREIAGFLRGERDAMAALQNVEAAYLAAVLEARQ